MKKPRCFVKRTSFSVLGSILSFMIAGNLCHLELDFKMVELSKSWINPTGYLLKYKKAFYCRRNYSIPR